MNCPACGAAMRLKDGDVSFVCDYCGAVHLSEANADGIRVLGEASPYSCSICRVPLVHAAAGRQRILYCPHCRGMLLAMDDFAELARELRETRVPLAAVPGQPEPRDLDRRMQCPRCGAMTDTHRYAGPGNVVVDSCERCQSIWLDYGELGRIVRARDATFGE